MFYIIRIWTEFLKEPYISQILYNFSLSPDKMSIYPNSHNTHNSVSQAYYVISCLPTNACCSLYWKWLFLQDFSSRLSFGKKWVNVSKVLTVSRTVLSDIKTLQYLNFLITLRCSYHSHFKYEEIKEEFKLSSGWLQKLYYNYCALNYLFNSHRKLEKDI